MKHYFIYIGPCYISTFLLFGLQIILTLLERRKILKSIGLQKKHYLPNNKVILSELQDNA